MRSFHHHRGRKKQQEHSADKKEPFLPYFVKEAPLQFSPKAISAPWHKWHRRYLIRQKISRTKLTKIQLDDENFVQYLSTGQAKIGQI